MTAIILAAGCARRFGKHLNGRPKCLLQVRGRNLLEHQVEMYRAHGIQDIVVVRGYNANQIVLDGVRFVLNAEYETTNMVHSLFCADSEVAGDTIISYADILFSADTLRAVLDAKDHHIGVAVDVDWQHQVALRYNAPSLHVESLLFNDKYELREIGAHAPVWNSVMGQYFGLLRVDVQGWRAFRKINAAAQQQGESLWCRGRSYKRAYMTDFLQRLIDEGISVHAIPIRNGWVEFDYPEDYERFLEFERSGQLSQFGL